MINVPVEKMAKTMKNFLEAVQPLPLSYGYARGIKKENGYVTYRELSSAFNRGIGNSLIQERKTYIITVQTKTALECMMFSELIKRGTERSIVEFVSDDIRKDTTVKDGWINTIILYMYTDLDLEIRTLTPEEVRQALQEIADRYIFVTSQYDTTLATSFIDRFIVPEMEKEIYGYDEFIALKQEYIDRLILNSTEY